MSKRNNYPKLHNAAWPGVVGKGSPDGEPFIDLDTMLDHTAKAEVDGVKFDGFDLFLFDPHISIDAKPDDLKKLADKAAARNLNIGSVVGFMGNPGQANYVAAKAGMVGFTKALAREVGSRNITVNCVAPGFIDTDMTRVLPEAQVAKLVENVPLARLGNVNDIAEAVLYLASPGAGYVTGNTIHVNGGMYMN